MKVQGRENMKRTVNLRLEVEQAIKLQAMADALSLTRSEVVRKLIESARYSPVVVDVDLRELVQ